ncbi:hypothetical protein K523DRAFT_322348 [Schizophyllum commune Tattone D]|nr:hypothetical protein K523DRAFT_322348 [Schizophyllum commune Tattone D]
MYTSHSLQVGECLFAPPDRCRGFEKSHQLALSMQITYTQRTGHANVERRFFS